ncbi:hypothetical protein BD408DRAFT_442128 [Parasitella parasitica]|nr:hypothetical protein BD408DRAFT_442128 [Parasitella parasitica]
MLFKKNNQEETKFNMDKLQQFKRKKKKEMKALTATSNYMKGFHIENKYMSLTSFVDAIYPPNRCTLCDAILSSRIESNQHFKEKHKNSKSRYICMHPYCDYRFLTRGALRLHISHAHLLIQSEKPLPDSFHQENLFSTATTTTPSPTLSGMSMEPMSTPASPPPSVNSPPQSAQPLQSARPPIPPTPSISEPIIAIKNEKISSRTLHSLSSPSSSPPNHITTKKLFTRQPAFVAKQPTFIDDLTPSPPPSPFSMYHPKKDSQARKAILSKKAELFLNSIYPPLQCPSCKQTFPRKTNVIKHLTEAHVGQEPYRCIYPKFKAVVTKPSTLLIESTLFAVMNHERKTIGQDMLMETFEDGFDDEDDFGDDIDMEELAEVADTVEQTHAAGQISFIPTGDDPSPPPLLPSNTPCPHSFDSEELRTWIYPTNHPIRGYQLNIVHKAMFNNTLVALPTGLGKTFIAAVVMYNYWRWFPNSKIIFLAHTRPLVDQQIEACFTICGIPQEETAEMTGESKVDKRRELWKSKRVFFATPQTVQNDLVSQNCPAHLISCIVFDEAHKATGNYAYTEVVRRVYSKNKHFRILALTATPGSNLDAVQSVITNLHISRIEIRTEESMDVRQFTHGKNTQRIVVKLGYTEGTTGILPRVIRDFAAKVFEPLLLDLSKKPTDVSPSIDRASAYGLRSSRLRFQETSRNLPKNLRYFVTNVFLVAEGASRAYDYLCQFGIRPFIDSIEAMLASIREKDATSQRLTAPERAFLNHSALNAILQMAKQEARKPNFMGHPKMDHLVSILLNHFTSLSEGEVSKVMVFSSFRSSVLDIRDVLDRHKPIIRSTIFVGQASDKQGTKGLNQREQQEVLCKFKSDEFNVLVATSIGEEGLDIGEIDLIICYDSQSSPIRMLQRMGRTGRKRQGKCIMLHTESEEKKFNQAKETYARVQGLIAKGVSLTYYKPEPQILPVNYKPTICRRQLVVGTYQRKATSRKQKSARNVDYTLDGCLQPDVEKTFIQNFCTQHQYYTNLEQISNQFWPAEKTIRSISKFVPLQAQLQATHRVGHSKRSLQLADLVEKMEHRIMHPDENIRVHVPKQQAKLKLPSRFPKNTLTMPTPRKRRKISDRLDDEDFQEFMQNSHIEQIVNLPVDTEQHYPPPTAPPPQEKIDKGKAKMTLSQEIKEMQATTDMGQDNTEQDADLQSWDNEPRSWEQMLPDHIFHDHDPLPDLSHQASSTSPPYPGTTPAKLSPPAPSPLLSPAAAAPLPLQQSSSFLSENDFGDDFDFSLDASFIEQADALVKSRLEPGFDDALEPKFDFEMANNVPDKRKSVTLIWKGDSPPFSEKGLKVLEERQKRLEARTGHRIVMYFQKKIQTHALSQHAAPRNTKPRERSPAVHASLDHFAEKEQEDDGFDDLDFNDDLFANFLENKIGEDGYYAENFVYGQDEKSTQNIAEKSILYVNHASHNNKQNTIAQNSAKYTHEGYPLPDKDVQCPKRTHQRLENMMANSDGIIEFDVDELNALSSSSEDEASKPKAPPLLVADSQASGALPRQQSAYTAVGSQDAISQKDIDEEDIDKSEETSQPSPLRYKSRRNIIVSEDEQESPSLLSALSKGLHTPSPLRQVKNTSPIVVKRRRLKRRLFEDEEEEEEASEPSKALNGKVKQRFQKKVINDEEEDEDDFIVLAPSQQDLHRRLMQSRKPTKRHHKMRYHKPRPHLEGGFENPFIDHEADYPSDEGHTDEDVDALFDSSASSLMNSFIDDEDSGSTERGSSLSMSDNALPLLPLEPDDLPRNEKHWMNRFDADKWLNINQEEDSVVVTDEEGEPADEESVQDFSSDLRNNTNLAAQADDGYDFM